MVSAVRTAVLAAGLACLAAFPVMAQTQGGAGSPVEVVAKHGAWEQRCVSSANAGRKCVLLQVATATENDKVSAAMTVARGGEGGQQFVARFEVPIGVYLPGGLSLNIDGRDFGAIPYQTCYPDRCAAIAMLSEEHVTALKAGARAVLTLYANPKTPLTVPISLSGITAGMGALG
ncbi:MAG: invasion associated locus B family protein [Minwuia sp.]|uniref:invasion associated locus B family protein n=1 Tax=Minwuia sp. TaxID=2493630 RepID=UPI003A8AB3E9